MPGHYINSEMQYCTARTAVWVRLHVKCMKIINVKPGSFSTKLLMIGFRNHTENYIKTEQNRTRKIF